MCALPDQICREDGYPKLLVRALLPPVVMSLSPPMIADMLSIVRGMDLVLAEDDVPGESTDAAGGEEQKSGTDPNQAKAIPT